MTILLNILAGIILWLGAGLVLTIIWCVIAYLGLMIFVGIRKRPINDQERAIMKVAPLVGIVCGPISIILPIIWLFALGNE